ncbi:MAG: hypothetical protein H7Y43_08810 [Akkermansiaceae bacterium]|nr:hypothetical protein [Verrucomicrobiales bacterium]
MSASLAALFVAGYHFGKISILEVIVVVAIFLWVLIGVALGIPRSYRARLLPYFERSPGSCDTADKGKSLLENSRKLDELALAFNVKPLSGFASGDDLIAGEKLVWFDPQPALATAEKLLQSEAAKDFAPELIADLASLRNALQAAAASQIRFCLLLREGSAMSGAEMEQRKGSFS